MKDEMINRRIREKELLSYDLYLCFKNKNIELSKYLLLESYLLNDLNVSLYELGNLFYETGDKEIAKNIYLLDSLNNLGSKEKWESMKSIEIKDLSNEYIKDYISNKKSKKLIHKIYLFISKDKFDKRRIKRLERLNLKYPHPDAAYEIANYYLSKKDLFEAKKYLGYAAYYKVDAAIKFLEIYNDSEYLKDNYYHFSMLKKYNNIKSNFEYSRLILNNSEMFNNEIINAKDIMYNIYDNFESARLYLADYNLDKNLIRSFFLYKTLNEKNEHINNNLSMLCDKILKDIYDKINGLLIEDGIYSNKIENRDKIKEYYNQVVNLDFDKSFTILYKAGILGHKPSLDKCIEYYKNIDSEKYLELLLYKYIFEKVDNIYNEIIEFKIDSFKFLQIFLKVNKNEKIGLENVLKIKLESNNDFKLFYNYYLLLDNNSTLQDEYKVYKKINKDNTGLGFLIYQESLGNVFATRVLIDYYLENNIDFNYGIDVYEELASLDHLYSIKYLLDFYKENDEKRYIELAINNIDKNLVDIKNIVNSSINSLVLYYFVRSSIEEKKNEKNMKDIIYLRGQDDNDFYYLNKFYELNSINETDFIDYLDEYICDESNSLTTIDFLKFLKKNEEELAAKYVNIYVRNKNHKLTYERIKEIIVENKNKEERKNKRIKKYTRQAKRGNQKAMLQLIKNNDSLSNIEKNELLYKACKNNNYNSIKILVLDYGFDFIRSHNRFKSIILNASENTYNEYASYIAAKVYENEEYCKEFKVDYSLEKSFINYKVASKIIKEDIKKEVWLKLANCYEIGIGTEVNLKEASKYYEPYNYKKSKELIDKYHVNEYIESTKIKAKKIFDKYPCKEFDLLYIRNKEKAEKIFNASRTWNEESIESQLKRRDYLLSIGLTIDEIYSDSGVIVESKIADKVKKIEDEIKRKQEEKIRKQLEERKLQEIKKQKELEEKNRVNQVKTQTIKEETNSSSLTNNINKSNDVKVSDNVKKMNSNNKSLDIKTPLYYGRISSDDKIYKELKPDLNNRIIDDEKKAIASLRRYLDYPEEPSYPQEYDGFVRLSKGKREKMYIQLLEERQKEIKKYKDRLFELENPFKKYGYNNFRKKVWDIFDNKPIVTGKEFAEAIKKEFNSISKVGYIEVKAKSYKFKDREMSTNNNVYLLERMFIHSPVYASEITLEIKIDLIYKTSDKSEYMDVCKEIEDVYDRTTLTRGDIYDLYDNMNDEIMEALKNDINRPAQEKYEASKKAKSLIENFVKNMFDKYNVFAGKNIEVNGKTQYFEGKVIKYKIEYIIK